jgi:hypothetical protein
MVAQVKALLFSYKMLDMVITYVQVEEGNLNSTTIALFYVVTCEPSTLQAPW